MVERGVQLGWTTGVNLDSRLSSVGPRVGRPAGCRLGYWGEEYEFTPRWSLVFANPAELAC